MNWRDTIEAELDTLDATPGISRVMAALIRKLGGPEYLLGYYEENPDELIKTFAKLVTPVTRPEPPAIPAKPELRIHIDSSLDRGPLDVVAHQ